MTCVSLKKFLFIKAELYQIWSKKSKIFLFVLKDYLVCLETIFEHQKITTFTTI